jgi:hypothetical protein
MIDDRDLGEVRFLPWVGPRYGDDGRPLLVVGNSHYGRPEEETDRCLTRDEVRDYPDIPKPAFFTRLAQVLAGEPLDQRGAREVLDGIAFYNFCQWVAADRPGVAPTSAMMAASKPAFWKVVDVLKPMHVLVLGNQVWMTIEDGSPTACVLDGEERHVHRYERNGHVFWALSIWHPASGHGFQLQRWAPWVRILRECGREPVKSQRMRPA